MTTVRVENHVPDFNAALRAALPKAVANMAEVYVSGAVKLMQRTGGRAGTRKGQAYNVPSAPGTPPAVQKGTLRRSITRSNPVNLVAKVGTNYAIGKFLEFGANPRAKGKKLAIPQTYEAQRAGTPRAMDLHFRPTKDKRTGLLVDDAGVVQFVLVDSVHIAARPWLRPTMNSPENKRQAEAVLAATIRKAVLSAVKGGAA